jgi:cobalt-zinc-cadmium efflux system protein
MKTERNILIAFLLNLFFSIIELVGGIFTNSVAIISDSVHDLGDSISIGISFVLEKKSKKKPDDKYTYGYARFSILGAFITTTILIVGSVIVIIGAINRIMNPVEINYNGMILFAVFGMVVNFFAALATSEGDSLNQKAVNLHMLEDVLGWVVVLVGSLLMKFTNISIIDPIMSMGVALFILIHATQEFKEILDLFLIKLPSDIDIDEIREHLLEIEGITDVHHIHIWSTDGEENYATMHVKANTKDTHKLKESIRNELAEHNIEHTTLELEDEDEECENEDCIVKEHKHSGHHHHH